MEDAVFFKRLRYAVAAGWWTALIGAVWMTLAWGVWLVVSKYAPGFIESLWGGIKAQDAVWVALAFFGAAKLILFVWLMVVICLTIWYRKLRSAA